MRHANGAYLMMKVEVNQTEISNLEQLGSLNRTQGQKDYFTVQTSFNGACWVS